MRWWRRLRTRREPTETELMQQLAASMVMHGYISVVSHTDYGLEVRLYRPTPTDADTPERRR